MNPSDKPHGRVDNEFRAQDSVRLSATTALVEISQEVVLLTVIE
jgi:hypothetical protein